MNRRVKLELRLNCFTFSILKILCVQAINNPALNKVNRSFFLSFFLSFFIIIFLYINIYIH